MVGGCVVISPSAGFAPKPFRFQTNDAEEWGRSDMNLHGGVQFLGPTSRSRPHSPKCALFSPFRGLTIGVNHNRERCRCGVWFRRPARLFPWKAKVRRLVDANVTLQRTRHACGGVSSGVGASGDAAQILMSRSLSGAARILQAGMPVQMRARTPVEIRMARRFRCLMDPLWVFGG